LVALRVEHLSFAYGSHSVFDGIDLTLAPMVTAVIGPNAVGKTTLLRCIAGMLKPRGNIAFDGRDIRTLGRKARAGIIGYLAQGSANSPALTVMEAVLLGRLQTLSWRVGDDDLAIALAVLCDLGLSDLAERQLGELSGGQQQMVSIAQVLVQRPKVLIMDEPTINLDLQHQLETLAMIRQMTVRQNLVTVLALHDLDLAARYADQIVVLFQGHVYATGRPASVLTEDMLRTVYGVEATIRLEHGIPRITPLRSVRNVHLVFGDEPSGAETPVVCSGREAGMA
jgi:iron complex transport system ATP-binding protein